MLVFESDWDAEQCMYHHTLSDLVSFVEMYGWDRVIQDIADYHHKKLLHEQSKEIA
jgi:hypothetical protein